MDKRDRRKFLRKIATTVAGTAFACNGPLQRVSEELSAWDGAAVDNDPTLDRPVADAISPQNGLGQKPYMGWSSWSLCASAIPGYGRTWLNERHVKAMSDAMHERLQRYGYTYINIDGGWTKDFDSYGRPVPDSTRFQNGIKSIADYVHSKGQKLGLHYIAGLPMKVYERDDRIYGTHYRASDITYQPLTMTTGWKNRYAINWSHPGAQAYIDSIATEFATWEIDFLKLDGVTPDIPQAPQALPTDNRGDVAAWSVALIKTGRPIWFTLSWYLNPAFGSYWRKYANAARANGDVEWGGHDQLVSWTEPYFGLRARWLDITQTLPQWHNGPATTMENWLPYIGNGFWADMDSLDVGNGHMDGLTEDERQSTMTLWAILSSPLYSGDDLTKLDSFGLSLLTNREVIAVNQSGLVPQAIYAGSKNPIWWSRNPDGSFNVALFNLNDAPVTVTVNFGSLGFVGSAQVRNLWTKRDVGSSNDTYNASLAPHACQFVEVYPGEGHKSTSELQSGRFQL
jgi:Alpha galactosidase A/Alpha galactosidase C-terminal beta sandwich domain